MPSHCPVCQRANIRKSKRRGLLESVVLRLFRVRPYRCLTCDWRFLGWAVPPGHRASNLHTPGLRADVQKSVSPLYEKEKAANRALLDRLTAGSEPSLERQ